jgi:hypothetical protein
LFTKAIVQDEGSQLLRWPGVARGKWSRIFARAGENAAWG